MDQNLAQSLRIAELAIEAIKAAGIDESDPDFATLVESECDALERLKRMLRAARYAEANAKAVKEMETEMKERRQRFEGKAETLRAIVKQAMEQIDLPKLEAPDFTASLTATRPAVVIEDEEAIPTQLCIIKRMPDKTAIKRAIEQGEAIPGASLSPAGHTLTVRVR